MNETEVLLESLEKMYEDMDDSSRIDHLKEQYERVARGQSEGQFEKGHSEYKKKYSL